MFLPRIFDTLFTLLSRVERVNFALQSDKDSEAASRGDAAAQKLANLTAVLSFAGDNKLLVSKDRFLTELYLTIIQAITSFSNTWC